MSDMTSISYRSNSTLAIIFGLLAIAMSLTGVLSALSLTARIQLLDEAIDGATISPTRAEAHDLRQLVLGIIELSLSFLSVICFMTWIYRSNRNARALGAEGMTYSPGWS